METIILAIAIIVILCWLFSFNPLRIIPFVFRGWVGGLIFWVGLFIFIGVLIGIGFRFGAGG